MAREAKYSTVSYAVKAEASIKNGMWICGNTDLKKNALITPMAPRPKNQAPEMLPSDFDQNSLVTNDLYAKNVVSHRYQYLLWLGQ